MEFIDSHCHVDASDFDADRQAMLGRARAAGITELIVVGASNSLDQARATVAFAREHEGVHATVGVHPHSAAALDPSWWPALCELAAEPDVVAVGETGLDFYYDSCPRDVQLDRFADHIELAASLGKPLICHIRDAHAEAASLLEKRAFGRVQTIIHCFTGAPADAQRYVDMDFYVSFSGIVSFKGKSAEPVRAAIAVVPLERLLVETDCPYLAPVPYRGKRNEPAYLVETARVLATERGLELAEIAEATAANTRRVFGLTPPLTQPQGPCI
jgi:TatD DNase family protein